MSEYIERDAALDAVSEWLMKALHAENMSSYNEGERAAYRTALSEIANLPAADVRPVVRGKWNRTDAYPHRLYCSVCYETYLKNDELLERWKFPLNFCPNCDADMREES